VEELLVGRGGGFEMACLTFPALVEHTYFQWLKGLAKERQRRDRLLKQSLKPIHSDTILLFIKFLKQFIYFF
jgi:hypothetical protein